MQYDGWLWITDPWQSLDHPRDTTLRLIEAAHASGIRCFWAEARQVAWRGDAVGVEVHAVTAVAPGRGAGAFALEPLGCRRPSDFAMLHYRTDPPVDLAYLHPLQLIDSDLERRRAEDGVTSELVNPASVLLGRCEKVLGTAPELMPPSVVASRWDLLSAFGAREGVTVAKPLHHCQSRGVRLLDWASGEAEPRVVLAQLTGGFTRPVLLQRYLPAVREGETRLWLVDGELLACARKRPEDGTFKIDMDKGATLAPHELTARERERLPAIATVMRAQKIRLAAVDLIDGFVTDFNFTSPGLLPLMESVLGRGLAPEVVGALARGGESAAPRGRAARTPGSPPGLQAAS